MSDATSNPAPIVIIGGGISGLTCAYHLQQACVPVRLLDAADRTGGVISTAEENAFRFELGPQSFLTTEPLLQLVRDLGLENDLLRADSRAPRYILLRGQVVPAPLSPPALLTTSLLSPATKWRLLTEMFHHSHPPAEDESIASFVRRKFGAELLDRLVAPFVSGIYAGDPERLSLRAAFPKICEFETQYGSVLRGALKSRPAKGSARPGRPGLCSFREGMETLPRALAVRLGDSVVRAARVTAIRRASSDAESLFELEIVRETQRQMVQARAVILACPAYVAGEILQTISQPFAESFSRIEYAPVAVVAAGYRRDQFPRSLNGFGFLVPRSEGLRLLGTVWNSSLFPGRAPEGMACFTSFAGGATDPTLCNLATREVGEIISAELARVLSISGPPVTQMVRCILRALPQYNLGHAQTVAALRDGTASIPGLFLTGNYLAGPSLGTCVEQARETADAVSAYLASTGATKTSVSTT